MCRNGVIAGGHDARGLQTLWFVCVGMPACIEGILKSLGMWEREKMLLVLYPGYCFC